MIGSEKGSVLVIVITGITILAAIGAGVATMVGSGARSGSDHSLSTQAYYAAESGLEWARFELRNAYIDPSEPDWETLCVDSDNFIGYSEEIETGSNIYFKITDAIVYNKDGKTGCGVDVTGWVGSTKENALAKRTILGKDRGQDIGHGHGTIPASFITKHDDDDDDDDDKNFLDELLFFGNSLEFSGNKIEGAGATIVIQDGLETSDLNKGARINVSNIFIGGDVNLDTGSASLGSSSDPGIIFIDGDLELWSGGRKIYGDVYVNGNFRLKDAHIYGNVYVDGDVELGWTPSLSGDSRIYYTGSLAYPNNFHASILEKVIKVDNIEDAPGYIKGIAMPDYDMPALRPDNWYADEDRDYLNISSGILQDGLKVFANSAEGFTSTGGQTSSDVIIISKGDITLTDAGGRVLSGVLFAPYGKVTFRGNSFTGAVIARDGFDVTSGGTTVTFRKIEDFFDNPDDIPINAD
jgi:hypothetical protein